MIELKKILLVEDNPMDVELTMEALSEKGLANGIVVARDGVEAMDYLKYKGKFASRETGSPAVILLDIKMPRMDGFEVLELIRTDPQLKTIPVVMLTSSREEFDLNRCYELGTNAYIVKPVDYSEFVAAVKSVGIFWAMLNELPNSR